MSLPIGSGAPRRRPSLEVVATRPHSRSWGHLRAAEFVNAAGHTAHVQRGKAMTMKYPLGSRVNHPTRGSGTVMQLMANGRTLVQFDNGEHHKYKVESMNKFVFATEPMAPQLFKFALGARVRHEARGLGTVTQHMTDARLRVAFDNGEEHRYKPSSMAKIVAASNAPMPAAHRPKLRKELLAAVKSGHAANVEALCAVEDGGLLEGSDDAGKLVLLAADGGHEAIAVALVGRGAARDATDDKGESALVKSARLGLLELARSLLAPPSPADPNLAHRAYRMTPILFAVKCGENAVPMVRELLLAKADPDKANGRGETALMRAASAGNKEVVDALVEGGANIDLEAADGSTAIMEADSSGFRDLAKSLSESSRSARLEQKSQKKGESGGCCVIS